MNEAVEITTITTGMYYGFIVRNKIKIVGIFFDDDNMICIRRGGCF